MKVIDSPKNPLIKALVRLKERRHREREGRFLIEGVAEVLRAQAAGVQLEMLLWAPSRLAALPAPLGRLPAAQLSEAAFARLSVRQAPDGLIAVAKMQQLNLDDIPHNDQPLLLVIDGVEKPGNLGALLRTADAVGCDGVILTDGGTDLYNPNVIRASIGSRFSRPVVQCQAEQAIDYLNQRGVPIIATSPSADYSYWDADYRAGCAIVLGAEHTGLGQRWLEAAEARVSIPMQGLADSLNVATAGALLLYEALRQRTSLAKAT